MNAAEVMAGLQHRWPDSEYLSIREAPQDSMRQGRKLDLLVVSLWSSRGHELDGVEVKVSLNDWRRELKEAGKADWWWHHVHRFWIAVPTEIADKVKVDLPPTWGLLAVSETASVIKVKAPKHDAKPFTWNNAIGLLRGAADAGPRALESARLLGERLGRSKAEAEFRTKTSDGQAQRQLELLQEQIRAFGEASGVDMADFARRERGRTLGEAVKLALGWSGNPQAACRNAKRALQDLGEAEGALRASLTVFEQLGVAS